MKHSMSPSSQCLSPSTLLDEPHPDHAFDAPRLLRPSSGTFECLPPEHTSNTLPPQRTCSNQLRSHSIRSTFEVPHLRGLCLGVPSAGATLRTLCLHLARLDPRTDPDHLRSHRDGAPRSPGIKPPARPRFTCCEPCPSPPKSLRTTDKQTSVSSTLETSPGLMLLDNSQSGARCRNATKKYLCIRAMLMLKFKKPRARKDF
ncbi:hypothetical protein GUJ93_ZPchr0009g1859 [Zizania palustris]|uniref:Uncharacterized protein n=1 Tax=Zizania palustris TaxID=103762 RepID=A0A8J5RME6_ZIZPA|nr:hypothetical protein GUJ93_ZPchr0009g1859 [Zizania palustris]